MAAIQQDRPIPTMVLADTRAEAPAITFNIDGKAALVLRKDGEILVRGEKVDDNKAVYEAFLGWLRRNSDVQV